METSMMTYYLLRENQESGPYTLKELKAMTLLSTDLIWVSEESTCWKYPTEFEDLKTFVKEANATEKVVKNASGPVTTQNDSIQVQPTQKSSQTVYASAVSYQEHMDLDETTPSFEELKRKYAEKAPKKIVWRRHANIGASLMGIATLVIGVMLAAFMIKKAVDNIEYEPMVATANAQEIESETLPVSTTNHSALSTVAAPLPNPLKLADSTKESTSTKDNLASNSDDNWNRNALKSTVKEDIKAVLSNEEKTSASQINDESTKGDQSFSDPEKDSIIVEKEEDEKKTAKPTLHVTANEYKVGLLGGISDLELSVTNPSSQSIHKAVLEVEYLKPNGKVTNSQMIEVSGLAPGSSKKIAIPNNSRGVSVRYKVVNIES